MVSVWYKPLLTVVLLISVPFLTAAVAASEFEVAAKTNTSSSFSKLVAVFGASAQTFTDFP